MPKDYQISEQEIPPAVYQIGDKILARMRKRKSAVENRFFIREGTVVKINLRLERYKIAFAEKGCLKWFSVNDITCITRSREQRLHKRSIQRKCHIVMTHEGRRQSLAGDGNCRFFAICNQLFVFGIQRSPANAPTGSCC